MDEHHFDSGTLRRALQDAYDAGPVVPLPVDVRRRQRADIAEAHRLLYRSLT
jgi:hypothetical protein